jgi:predicted nucleotidyltransferase
MVKHRERIMDRHEIIQTLRSFVEMNRDRYEIIRFGIFGSAARDTMEELSDIDVVVELGKPDLSTLSVSSRIWKKNYINLWTS